MPGLLARIDALPKRAGRTACAIGSSPAVRDTDHGHRAPGLWVVSQPSAQPVYGIAITGTHEVCYCMCPFSMHTSMAMQQHGPGDRRNRDSQCLLQLRLRDYKSTTIVLLQYDYDSTTTR